MARYCIGEKYGKLTILEEISQPVVSIQKYRKSLLMLKCQCECGSIITCHKGNVLYGKTTQCRNCQNSHITIGEKRGSLTVLSRVITEKNIKYLCRCDCGFEDNYRSRFLQHGKKLLCKKCKFPKKYAAKSSIKKTRKEAIIETNYLKHLKSKSSLIGRKNGRLKIIGFSHWEIKKNRRRAYYKAKCKCGKVITIRDCFNNKSCGCLQKDSIPKAENNKQAKLNNSQVLAIREFKKANLGYTGRQLAIMFEVSEFIISNLLSGKTYRSVK